MAELFKPTFQDHRTGQTRKSKYWYARIHGKRVPLKVTDKKVAERKAREIERQLELGNDPTLLQKARRWPITEHLLAFEESLRAKGCSAGHIGTLLARLRKLIEGCGISTLADVNPSAIESWLSRRQQEGAMSAQTRKHYATHALQFGRFIHVTGRAAKNPFAGLRKNINVENDRRRRRRSLSPEECQHLLAAAARSKRKLGGMTGPDRRIFYLICLNSGLRRNEMGSLTPASFQLDAEPPTVTVEGKETKSRKIAILPLRQDVAAELRKWLRGKPAGKPHFPVKGRKRRIMLWADLKAAGIEPIVDGKVIDLHALRTTFITHLSLSGVPLAVAQKLARHSDPRLTSNVYTSLSLADLYKAIQALPPTGPAPTDPKFDGTKAAG